MFKGNPWVINEAPWTVLAFWATWCAPCKKELPELNAWSQSRTDVNVLAVNVDDNLDSEGVLKALKVELYTFAGCTECRLVNTSRCGCCSPLVLLDSTGTERYRMIGYSPSSIVEMESMMTAILLVSDCQCTECNVEWYPKPTLTDVLYDGQQFWLLDDQQIKHVETLTGWLDATEQETIVNAPQVSENNPAERLIQVGMQLEPSTIQVVFDFR